MRIFKEKYLSKIIMFFPIALLSCNIFFLVVYIQVFSQNKASLEDFLSNVVMFSIVLFFVSLYISLMVSRKVSKIFNKYKKNIGVKQNALQNINAVLEKKVNKKTNQLAKLNEELHQMVKDEVEKNREKDKVLFQQSKMASMGEMINNIAHQWRQPLSTISTAASGLNLKVDMDMCSKEEIKKNLDNIVETTQHLSQTIEDFRSFFLENKQVERFLLSETIKKNLSLTSSTLKASQIQVVEEYGSIQYDGIKNELIQAIQNIINNAKDALVEKTAQDSKRIIYIKTYVENDFAYITITDNAGGIKEEIMAKIFEPYFTTKHQSHGTGIGLYMTREIIVNHMNGDLSVENSKFEYESKEYEGAKFIIKLPLTNNKGNMNV